MLFNQSGVQGGLASCAEVMDVPLFQDGGEVWTTLGVSSYTAQIYDQTGTLAHEITSAFFTSQPDKVIELENAVNNLL